MYIDEMFESYYFQCNNDEYQNYCQIALYVLSLSLILVFYGILKFILNYLKIKKINGIQVIKPNHLYLGYTVPFLPSSDCAHRLLYDVHENTGGIGQFTFYNQRFVMISRPGLVKDALKNIKGKGIPIHKSPTRYDNRNIFNLDDGEEWKIRRKLFRQSLNNVNLQCMENELQLSLQNLIDYIENKLDNQYEVENDLRNGPLIIQLDSMFSRFALQVISNVGFQMNINCFDDISTSNISKAVDDLFQASQVAYHPLSDIIIFLGTFFGHPFTDARRILLNYADRIYDNIKHLQNDSTSTASTTTSTTTTSLGKHDNVVTAHKQRKRFKVSSTIGKKKEEEGQEKEQEEIKEEIQQKQEEEVEEEIESPIKPKLHRGSLGHAMMLLEQEEGITPDDVKNEIFLMFIAGHETSSHTLSWFFYTLAKYPDIKRHVFDELDSVFTDSTASIKYTSELPPYTEAVLRESMRRYPVVFVGSARRVNQSEGYDLHVEDDYPFGSSLDTTTSNNNTSSYSGSERCHAERMAAANRTMFKGSSSSTTTTATTSTSDETTKGTRSLHLPHGTWVQTNTYALHHDQESWDLPFSFQPERWLVRDEEGVPVKPYRLLHDSSVFMSMTASSSSSSSVLAFAPFSIGPRNCVGMNLALMEIRATIRVLCQRYTFHFQNHLDDKMMQDDYAISTSALIMQPRDKLPMVVHRRPIKMKQKQRQKQPITSEALASTSSLDPSTNTCISGSGSTNESISKLEPSSRDCSSDTANQRLSITSATNSERESSSISVTNVDQEVDDSGYKSDDEAEPKSSKEEQLDDDHVVTTNYSNLLPLTTNTTETRSEPVPSSTSSSTSETQSQSQSESQKQSTLQTETKDQAFTSTSASDFDKEMDMNVEMRRQQLPTALDRASSDPNLMLSQPILSVMQSQSQSQSQPQSESESISQDRSATSSVIATDINQTESPSEHTFVLPLHHRPPPPAVSQAQSNEDTTVSAAAHQPITSSTAIIDNHNLINVEPGYSGEEETTRVDESTYTYLREVTNTNTTNANTSHNANAYAKVRGRSKTMLEEDMEIQEEEATQERASSSSSSNNNNNNNNNNSSSSSSSENSNAEASSSQEMKDDEVERELESTSVAALASDWQPNLPPYHHVVVPVEEVIKGSTAGAPIGIIKADLKKPITPTTPPPSPTNVLTTSNTTDIAKPKMGRIKLSRNPIKFIRRFIGQEKDGSDGT